jgi:hypothetical protein
MISRTRARQVVPLEARATLLRHRLRGSGTDQPGGGEVMTSRYSHGGYGWNQQLRRAVTLLHATILSYGRPAEDVATTVRIAN